MSVYNIEIALLVVVTIDLVKPFCPTDESETLDERSGFDTTFTPDIVVADGDKPSAGGHEFEAIHTPGHASDHMAFALGQTGTVFTGDHVMGWSMTVIYPPDGYMPDYITSLDKLLKREDTLYLPGRGPKIREPRAFVRSLKAHRLRASRRCSSVCSRGIAVSTTSRPRSTEEYRRSCQMPRAGTVWAHLESLAARGLAVADGPATMTTTYRAVPNE